MQRPLSCVLLLTLKFCLLVCVYVSLHSHLQCIIIYFLLLILDKHFKHEPTFEKVSGTWCLAEV